MSEISKKTGIAFIALLAAIPCEMAIGNLFEGSYIELEIQNSSNSTIKNLTVDLCSNISTFENLAQGNVINEKLKFAGDCSYKINVIFEGGKTNSKVDGYLTGGFVYKDKILISEDSIKLENQSVTPDPNHSKNTIFMIASYLIMSAVLFFIFKSVILRVSKKHRC